MGPEISALNVLDQVRLGASTPRPDQLAGAADTEKAAKEFEAIFIGQFLEQMWAGIDTPEPFGGGHSETVFRSLLNQEIAQKIADRGGLGIADQIMRELIDLQENRPLPGTQSVAKE